MEFLVNVAKNPKSLYEWGIIREFPQLCQLLNYKTAFSASVIPIYTQVLPNRYK